MNNLLRPIRFPRFAADSSPRKGFTLVELMMALAISSILLVMLASMLESTLNAYSGQQRRSSATVEGRAGLEILRADLRSYCASPDDPVKTGDNLVPRFIYLPAQTERGSDRLAFFRRVRIAPGSSANAGADQGSVVLMAYAVGFTPDSGGRSSQKLYRRQFTTEETYVKLRDWMQLGTALLSEAEWQAVAHPPVPSGAEVSAMAASVAEPIVFQVIQFKVRPLAALLAQVSDPQSVNGIEAPAGIAAWTSETRPVAADVFLRVTNRGMAARLVSEEDWRAEGDFQTSLLGRPVTPGIYSDDPEVETQQLRIHLPRF